MKKNPQKNRISWTVEWKDWTGKWNSQKFFLYQEAVGFATAPELEDSPTILIRESRESF